MLGDTIDQSQKTDVGGDRPMAQPSGDTDKVQINLQRLLLLKPAPSGAAPLERGRF